MPLVFMGAIMTFRRLPEERSSAFRHHDRASRTEQQPCASHLEDSQRETRQTEGQRQDAKEERRDGHDGA